MNIIFLDIDGVLNCQLLYDKKTREELNDREKYYQNQLCPDRISWLNDLCNYANAKVVISSSWRHSKTIEWLSDILKSMGATFEIIGLTPVLRGPGIYRGNEIQKWIEDNTEITGKPYHEFYTYAIIDDDSDMLLWQRDNFFQTDTYAGLTPQICYRIKRHFHKLDPTLGSVK